MGEHHLFTQVVSFFTYAAYDHMHQPRRRLDSEVGNTTVGANKWIGVVTLDFKPFVNGDKISIFDSSVPFTVTGT